jgi:hypothetical protein
MCIGVLETTSPAVLWRVQKSSLCKAICLVFVCAHARSYVFITYENVSGSFETPSCYRNVRTLHELAFVRKVVSRSLPRFLLVHPQFEPGCSLRVQSFRCTSFCGLLILCSLFSWFPRSPLGACPFCKICRFLNFSL